MKKETRQSRIQPRASTSAQKLRTPTPSPASPGPMRPSRGTAIKRKRVPNTPSGASEEEDEDDVGDPVEEKPEVSLSIDVFKCSINVDSSG